MTPTDNAQLTPEARQAIAREIEALNSAFWFEVDRHGGAEAHRFFVADGSYTTSLKTRRGREAIAAFYRDRTDRGPRVSRHVATNHHVTVTDADHAEADWILLLYAADGAPVLPSAPAIMIADVHDVCVREADAWRYQSRTITALFKSDTPTTG